MRSKKYYISNIKLSLKINPIELDKIKNQCDQIKHHYLLKAKRYSNFISISLQKPKCDPNFSYVIWKKSNKSQSQLQKAQMQHVNITAIKNKYQIFDSFHLLQNLLENFKFNEKTLY